MVKFEDELRHLVALLDSPDGGCVLLAAIYGAFVVLGLALVVICIVGGTLLFTLMDAAAYLQGQPNVAGPWMLMLWVVILLVVVVWCWYRRRSRQQRSSRQASSPPTSEPMPEPVPSVLLEAMQVLEDEQKRYGEL